MGTIIEVMMLSSVRWIYGRLIGIVVSVPIRIGCSWRFLGILLLSKFDRCVIGESNIGWDWLCGDHGLMIY